jgi:CheY-like chemotaxis protein
MSGHEPVAILIVNDRVEDLEALQAALVDLDETIVTATSAREGLAIAAGRQIGVAILDIRMPEMDGFAMAERLRTSETTRDLPILFVSALDPTPEMLDRVYSLGAVDYLPSPVATARR